MTIGDVLAAIGLVLLVLGSWAATLILVALAFPARVGVAENRLRSAPGRCFAAGLGVVLGIGILAGVLNSMHAGPLRLLGGALITALGIFATIGSAAIVRLLGDRIQGLGSHMAPFSVLTRSSLLYVGTGMVPFFGWFIITPAALILSVGSGLAGMASLPARLSPTLPGRKMPVFDLGPAAVVNAGIPGDAITASDPASTGVNRHAATAAETPA